MLWQIDIRRLLRFDFPRSYAAGLIFSLSTFLLVTSSCTSSVGKDRDALQSWQSTETSGIFSPFVAAAIRHSRDAALGDGASAIPRPLREKLEPHFPPDLLDKVRWTTVSDRISLDSLAEQMRPRCNAMTFDYVIIFIDPSTTENLDIWLHELVHVQQFAAVGVDEFARQYIARPEAVEAATRERAATLAKAASAKTFPAPSELAAKSRRKTF